MKAKSDCEEVRDLGNAIIALCNHSDLSVVRVMQSLSHVMGAIILTSSKDLSPEESELMIEDGLEIAIFLINEAIEENIVEKRKV
jgi:hypothetical protein